MQIGNVRFHLRHTGSPKFRLRLTKLSLSSKWGWNLVLGRWLIVARRPSPYAPTKFFDLGFGKRMLQSYRYYHKES